MKKLILFCLLLLSETISFGQYQNSLHFDGVNDKVDLPAGLNRSLTSYTLQAWIKTTDGSGVRAIFVRSGVHGLFLNNNQLAFYNWATGQFSLAPGTLNDNQWHHVAVTFTHGTFNSGQFYVDGVASGIFNPGHNTLINNYSIGHNTNGQFFTGNIDDVIIHNRILTPTEILSSVNSCSTPTNNLVASYNFNQGIPQGNNVGVTNLLDQSGNNYHGTLANFILNGSTSNLVDGKSCCFLSSNITGTTVYCQGETINLNASFTVKSGQSIIAYQWKKNGINLTNGGNVSGATSSNLQIANAVSGDFVNYSLEVTSTCGSGSSGVNTTESGAINVSRLTAHYPFNSNSANDVSGNNYNAIGSDLTSVVNRFNQANTAFSFNGTSSNVTINAPTGQTILGNGQNKSISLWFKRGSTTSKGMLLSYQQATPGSWNPLAYIGNDGVLRGWMYQGGTIPWSSGITIDTNWHHLALVYTTNVQTVYLDGSQVTSLSGTLSPGSSNIIIIGNGYANTGISGISVTGNQPFSGVIDEVRFYDWDLSLADINTISANPFLITNQPIGQCVQIGASSSLSVTVSGDVTYQWQKNGIDIPGATSNILNFSNFQQSDFALYRCLIAVRCNNSLSSQSNEVYMGIPVATPQPSRVYTFDNINEDHLLRGAYHGVLNQTVNTPASFSSDRFGIVNSAHYRGNWSSVSLNKSLNLANMTISMWVNLSNGTGTHGFLAPPTNTLPYHLFSENRQLKIRPTSGAGSDIITPYFLPASGWVQIAMVYQGSKNTLYVNGQEVFTTNFGINLSANAIGTIAGLPGGAVTARYLLDDVYVFEQALSAAEIQGLYADGAKAPYFYLEPINDFSCQSSAIKFKFQSAVTGSVVLVKKNGVDLPAGGNVLITDTSVVISNPTAADFTNYTIILRNGCGSVSKTVNAVQLSNGYATQGLVRFFPFNNSLNDAIGGPALSIAGGINYTSDRFGNANSAYLQYNGSSLFLPTAAVINNSPFTVNFWVNSYPSNTSYQLFSSGSPTSVGLSAQNQYLGFSLGNNNVGYKQFNVFTGNWIMLTMSFDGQIVKIYSNETLVSVHRPQNATTYLQTFIDQIQCQIDDIRIYNRVLADEEVRGLYRISNISTQPQNQSVCVGQTANLSVNAQALAGNTLTYQWTFNGNTLSNGASISGATTNNLQISNSQVSNAGTYNCIVSSGCNETTSTSVTLSVGAGNVNITQQPQNTSVCVGGAASLSITTQGATVTYQWKKNGVNIAGATNSIFNLSNLNSNDAGNYTVDIIGGSCGTITSQTATLTVLALPVAVITPTSPSICEGQSISLTAIGGVSYSWDNNLGTGDTKSVTPSTTTTYSVVVTGANSCVASASQTVTVINTPTPTGTASQIFCNIATIANLSATGTGIQWYAGASGGSPLAAGTTLTNGSTYYSSQTVSTCESVNRLAVLVTINTTSTPTGAPTQSVCSGATVADLSATGTGIQWYAAPTGGTALATGTVLSNGTTYYASQTANGCESVTRLAVTVTIGIPNAPIGTAAQTFCNSATVANLVASGSNIQWYAASTGGTALLGITALSNGTTYYASQTAGGCESTARLTVSVTINAPATPTGTATQEFCNAGSVVDLTATGTGIQWYTAPTGGTALTTGTALSNGTYYASQTLSGCESATRLAVAVTINAPTAPTGATTQSFCGTAILTDITVTGANITYYDAASAGNTLAPGTALANGVTYFATQTVNGCESINRLAVTATVNAIPAAPTATAPQEFCNGAIVADLTATGSGIQWYAADSGGTALTTGTALTSGSYFAAQTVNGCESTDRTEATVNIITHATPSGDAAQNFCSVSTVADLTATGTAIQWYTQATGGTALAGGTALSNSTYFATQTINGCESQRLEVTVTVTLLDSTVTVNGLTLTANQAAASYTWVDCSNGNQPIAGANGQSYTPTANGSYAVIVEQNGCTVTSNCAAITTVGLEDVKEGLFRVYPNPASTEINVELDKTTAIRIVDVTGKLLLELNGASIYSIDVKDLSPGMYIIESAVGDKAKFIKK